MIFTIFYLSLFLNTPYFTSIKNPNGKGAPIVISTTSPPYSTWLDKGGRRTWPELDYVHTWPGTTTLDLPLSLDDWYVSKREAYVALSTFTFTLVASAASGSVFTTWSAKKGWGEGRAQWTTKVPGAKDDRMMCRKWLSDENEEEYE